MDAVELMDVGANYLREHIPSDWKLHYTIVKGGENPNTVPDNAQSWYMLRANDKAQVEELHSRILKIAKGAAMMTGTTVSEKIIAGCYDYKPNMTLSSVLLECIKEIGAPKWTEEDYKFGEKLKEQLPKSNIDNKMKQFDMTNDDVKKGLVSVVYGSLYNEGILGAATDVADVSWQIPVACFGGAATVVGAPNHSWFYTAPSGTGIGHRAARTAAQILALAGYRVLNDPDLVKAAKKELKENLSGETYKCPL